MFDHPQLQLGESAAVRLFGKAQTVATALETLERMIAADHPGRAVVELGRAAVNDLAEIIRAARCDGQPGQPGQP